MTRARRTNAVTCWRRTRAGSAYLVDEPCGRGRVILFAQDPGCRCAWDFLHGFLLHAGSAVRHQGGEGAGRGE